MDKIIEFLNKNNISFDIGIINNGYFYKLEKPFKNTQVINFKWKSKSLNKLLNKLEDAGINNLTEVYWEKYNALFNIEGTNNQILITFAVDSHVQLPKLLLKNFRTQDYLFYINAEANIIKRSSASSYNTCFGYYSIWFEQYLSKNYEKIISNIIKILTSFINGEFEYITLKDLNKNVNKLFFMALIRNPKFIKEVNNYSLTSKLFDGGYDTEFLAVISEKEENNFIKNYTPVPLINITNKNLVTLKSLIANIHIDHEIECMVILLHPKFAIALIPNEYYKKMIKEQGQQTYLQLNDERVLIKINEQIYKCAKYNKEDVIGIKDDIEELLYKNSKNRKIALN